MTCIISGDLRVSPLDGTESTLLMVWVVNILLVSDYFNEIYRTTAIKNILSCKRRENSGKKCIFRKYRYDNDNQINTVDSA